MKRFASAALLCSILLGCSNNSAPPPAPPGKGVEVHVPGVDVKVDKGGVDVKAPGVDVDIEKK